MKFVRYTLVCSVFLLLVQCKPKKDPNKIYFDTPSEYNDFIVKEQQEVMAAFDDFANAINKAFVDSIQFYHQQLTERTELAEATMNKLADYKGDTTFRFHAKELFSYINHACKNDLQEIVDITSTPDSISVQDVKRIADISDNYTVQERDRNNALIKAQENFAAKFNVNVK